MIESQDLIQTGDNHISNVESMISGLSGNEWDIRLAEGREAARTSGGLQTPSDFATLFSKPFEGDEDKFKRFKADNLSAISQVTGMNPDAVKDMTLDEFRLAYYNEIDPASGWAYNPFTVEAWENALHKGKNVRRPYTISEILESGDDDEKWSTIDSSREVAQAKWAGLDKMDAGAMDSQVVQQAQEWMNIFLQSSDYRPTKETNPNSTYYKIGNAPYQDSYSD